MNEAWTICSYDVQLSNGHVPSKHGRFLTYKKMLVWLKMANILLVTVLGLLGVWAEMI